MPNYLYPVVVIGVLLLLGAGMRAMTAAANPAHQLANIAQVLGVQVVEGNPSYNLITGKDGNFLLRLFGIDKYDVRIRARGQAVAHPIELAIDESLLRIKLGRMRIKDDRTYSAHISVSNVPMQMAFEAWRPSGFDGPVPKLGLPVIGQAPTPSGPWQLASNDPTATQWLAPLLANLSQNASHFHVTGSGGAITLWFTHTGMSVSVLQLAFLRDELFRLVGVFAGHR